jgi:thioredoxin reductase (NADPH)
MLQLTRPILIFPIQTVTLKVSLSGSASSPENLNDAHWPINRQSYLLENSLLGVFAVGDVRGGGIKRVASAVEEGSIAISFVYKVLQE